MKVPSQKDPSGPNGAKQKSENSVPGPLGLNLRNSHKFRTNFVRISYEFGTNFVRFCRKFVRNSCEFGSFVRNLCECCARFLRISPEPPDSYEIRTKLARNSYKIRTNFVRISEISKSLQKITQIHVKFTQIPACVNVVNSRCVHGD